MKLPTVITKNKTINRMVLKYRKNRPDIKFKLGVAGLCIGTVGACISTLKAKEAVDQAKEDLEVLDEVIRENSEKIEEARSDESPHDIEEYELTKTEAQKQACTTMLKTGVKVVGLYAPWVVLDCLSVRALASSHLEVKGQFASAMAMASGYKKQIDSMRKRISDKYGDKVEQEIYYGVHKAEITEEVTDDKGKVKTKTKKVQAVDPDAIGPHAFFFEEYITDESGVVRRNHVWTGDPIHDLMIINRVERELTDRMRARKWVVKDSHGKKIREFGYIFKNEILEALGHPHTKDGHYMGIIYDPQNGYDTAVEFGLRSETQQYVDFRDGLEQAILLDPNIMCNVLELM